MKNRKLKRRTAGGRRPGYAKAMLPALVAVGSGFATAPATALELGHIVVHSTIGQPLRASVVYALGPNESIDSYCVSVRPARGGSEIPGVARPSVRVADGKITITGRDPVVEPMVSTTLTVKCPYTPHVVREYLLFMNPAGMVPVKMESASAASVAEQPPAAGTPIAAAPATSSTPGLRAPIEASSQYLVQPGDSLSRIAMLLEGRNADLQSAMDAIFAANPDAFIGGDPNLIKAGSLIDIPAMTGFAVQDNVSASSFDMAASEAIDASANDSYSSVYEGVESVDTQPAEQSSPASTGFDYGAYDAVSETRDGTNVEVSVPEGDAAAAEDAADSYAGLVPGDPVVSDTEAEPAEVAADPTPARTQAIGAPEPAETSSWNWLIWIAAGAISIFGGVLLIGPRLRERFGSKPVGSPDAASRPISEHAAPSTPATSAPEPTMAVQEITPADADVDFDLSDDSPTEENLALDADLIAGTGLAEGGDVQVNQDFGFAATQELDLELTEQAVQEDDPETDIIPPPERPEDLVVEESDTDDDTEYDMSVIVDATKMPDPADVTERDLKAVPLDDTGQTPIADAYTIEKDQEFDVLEQDYEDELTKTQALNEEIERAAAELAERMDDTVETSSDTSVEMQLANLADLDLTATLEAQNDDLDVTAKIETDDETVEMPSKGKGGA